MWATMPSAARARVDAAPERYRTQLVELWGLATRNEARDPSAARDAAETEGATVQAITRAIDDAWPDGRRRSQLQRVMQARLGNLQRSGFTGLDDCRRRDRAAYDRFLAGCVRAMNRDGLIAAGLLGQGELSRMKYDALGRIHEAQFAGVAQDFDERYGT